MMEERAVWNEVSTDFDPDEETANFGTRHALESGDHLYEVKTSPGCILTWKYSKTFLYFPPYKAKLKLEFVN